jgi:hypothetical protein
MSGAHRRRTTVHHHCTAAGVAGSRHDACKRRASGPEGHNRQHQDRAFSSHTHSVNRTLTQASSEKFLRAVIWITGTRCRDLVKKYKSYATRQITWFYSPLSSRSSHLSSVCDFPVDLYNGPPGFQRRSGSWSLRLPSRRLMLPPLFLNSRRRNGSRSLFEENIAPQFDARIPGLIQLFSQLALGAAAIRVF